jgi:hypothetical protein
MWRRFDQITEVALFVRTWREGEQSGAAVSLRTLLRQQMDALGLTGPGLARLRWVIATEEEAIPNDGDRPDPPRSDPDAKSRILKLVIDRPA